MWDVQPKQRATGQILSRRKHYFFGAWSIFFGSFVNFFEIERVNCGNWRELGIKKIFDSISIVRKKCRNVDKDKDKDN